ncbi:hypothetical protein EYR41_004213 [Orbilia oligospora]|uniref:Uncharacterized protein n=1 Tax=Orbilia oligospora TaxID=2813651 RepID=A0A8H2E4E4_ORBOL|nr:hypothetical protein EYR41_004213 [Orbilia oligospora]
MYFFSKKWTYSALQGRSIQVSWKKCRRQRESDSARTALSPGLKTPPAVGLRRNLDSRRSSRVISGDAPAWAKISEVVANIA